MSWSDEIRRDTIEVETIIPLTFVWGGLEIACVADKFSNEFVVDIDGNHLAIDLSLRVRIELLLGGALPKSGDLIQFPGPTTASGAAFPVTEYRVRRIRSKQASILWVDCIDENV
jgi:hypothetical protein